MKNKNTTTTNTTKKMWKWKENMQNRRQQHILSYQIEKKLERSCLFCYGKLETSPSSVLANNIRNMCGIACDRQTNFRPIEWVTGWGGMRTGEVSAYIHIHTSWSPSCPSFNSKLILCALPHYSHRSFFFTSFFAGAAAFASFGEWRNANKCTFIWIRFYWPASERYNNNEVYTKMWYVETELTQNTTDIGCDDLLSINHRKNISPAASGNLSARSVYSEYIYWWMECISPPETMRGTSASISRTLGTRTEH